MKKDCKQTDGLLQEEIEFLRSRVKELEVIEKKYTDCQSTFYQQEDFFHKIFDAFQDGISILDTELNILQVNQWMVDYYQDKQSIPGRKCYEAYHGKDSVCTWCPTLKTLETGQTHSSIIPYTQDNETVGWLDLTTYPMKDAEGQITGVIEHVKNVTEQKKIVDALHETLEVQKALLSTLPAFVFLKDRNLNYMSVNKMAANLMGKPLKEIIGKSDFDFFPEPIAQKFRQDDLSILQSGQSKINFEEEIVSSEGDTFIFNVSKSPMKDEAGNVTGIVGIAVDITEKKKLENRLQFAQKMDAIGQLASGIAHNINNLLTGIMGNLGLAQADMPQEVNRYIKNAQEAAEMAADLINDLLVFSRRKESELKPTDLNTITKRVFNLARRTIDRRIEMIFEPSPKPINIHVDESQFNFVLMNLCLNARDAIDAILDHQAIPQRKQDPFYIKIKTDSQWTEPVESGEPSPKKATRHAVIQVMDNGIGMEEDTRKHVFEPFYSTKDTVGTGMGLSSAFGVIKQHQGWIECVSEYGKGTTFFIYLPELDKEGQTKEKRPAGGAMNKVVLIVEDEDIVLSVNTEILQKNGYQVIQASDGKKGLDIFEKNVDRIDLVLLDLSLPYLSGQEILGRMLQINPHVDIIVCSGYGETVDIDELIKCGARGYLAKPFRSHQLIQAVQNAIGK